MESAAESSCLPRRPGQPPTTTGAELLIVVPWRVQLEAVQASLAPSLATQLGHEAMSGQGRPMASRGQSCFLGPPQYGVAITSKPRPSSPLKTSINDRQRPLQAPKGRKGTLGVLPPDRPPQRGEFRPGLFPHRHDGSLVSSVSHAGLVNEGRIGPGDRPASCPIL